MVDIQSSLSSGEPARLMPIVSDSSREVRAVSIVLATLMAVPSFAKVMLGSVGQRVGVRTDINCYTEVVFNNCPEGGKLRPDGLIDCETGRGRSWSCLVEAKIGRAKIDTNQVAKYVALAKANGAAAIITILNEFVALPTHAPVKLSKTQTRGVDIFHWSWMYLLTQASLLLNTEEFDRPEQRYILAEMVRYFTHPSIGVSTFEQMNKEWRDVVLKVQSGAQIIKSSPETENTVAAWHQECRDLCLLMIRKLNRQVNLNLSRTHADDSAQRLKEDCELLASKFELLCTLEVPNAAAPMVTTANLLRRSLTVSMVLQAPKDRQRSSSRINWILRQLSSADPDGIFIKARWPRRSPDTQAKLSDIRANPKILEAANQALVPVGFEVMLVRDLAGKFSGSRNFIEQVEDVVPTFYEQVGQHLRNYVPPPPKMARTSVDKEDEGPIEEVAHNAENASVESVDDTADAQMMRREGDPVE